MLKMLAISRGDKAMALHLASAMYNMPGEGAYFLRRLCVIACEDVGPADDILTSFVIACAAEASVNRFRGR